MKIAENDKCVLCGRDAGVPADMPVSERTNYVRGCGQLCEDCFYRLYRRPDTDSTVSDEEMKTLLELCTEEMLQ